jgi:hypothetical protein
MRARAPCFFSEGTGSEDPMGAGLSREQIYTRTRTLLRGIQRELVAAGVPCHYCKRAIRYGVGVPSEKADLSKLPDRDFSVDYGHGNMSNGESVLTAHIRVEYDGTVEDFYGLDFEAGMARVRVLFGKEAR